MKSNISNGSDFTDVDKPEGESNYNSSDGSKDVFNNWDEDESDHHPNHQHDDDVDDEHDSSTIKDCNNQWYIRHNNPLVPMAYISPGHTNQMGFLSITKNHQGISIRNDLLPI
jgi:hypothetical protein